MVDQTDDSGWREQKPFRLRTRAWAPIGFRSRRSLRLRRFCLALVTFVISLSLFALLGVGLLSFRLSRGPIAVALETQVAAALSSRVKHGLRFTVGGTDIESAAGRPALVVKQLLVKDEAGRTIIHAPEAVLAIDPLQLIQGALVPNRLDLRGITVKLSILPDGDFAFAAGTEETMPFRVSEAFETGVPGPVPPSAAPKAPTAATPPQPAPDLLRQAASSLAMLIDKLTGADDAFGGFDRLGIEHATLILDDRTHNAVTTFRELQFEFDKVADGAAKLTLAADGIAGRWSVSLRGVRYPDARRGFALDVKNLTLPDLDAVPAFRSLGFDTDLPLGATLNVGLDESGAIAVARGQLSAGTGFLRLHDPDHEPVLIDSIVTAFRYDPAARTIVIDPSEIKADTDVYRFEGQVTPPTDRLDGPWTFKAGGKGIFGPTRPGEKPVALDKIELAAFSDPGQRLLRIDRLSLAGPQVSADLSAQIADGSGGMTVKAKVTAGRMPAPVILRLWPSLLSAQVRAWLLANVQGGTVERGTITANLDEADIAKIKAQRSVADDHLQLDYAVSDMNLTFMAGVPPMHGLSGAGTVTGDTSKFLVTRGLMDVAPGRQLALSQGSLTVPSTDPKPTPATVMAQVSGPIDVLTELLSRDALKSYAGLPPEAASAKGQIDGTLTVGLKLGQTTRNDDLKVGANAKIRNLTIEKLVGKQNLTNGDINLVLDSAGLRARGEAEVFGAPTSIDIRKPAGTDPGEANVSLTLDEAARVRAGINLGRTVAGPVTAKINAILGAPDKKANVELDLTRASLTNVMPGLSKPSGKPARVTLVATQKDSGVALDNIACDFGAVSVRGSASLDGNGGFQGAKLSQARLSPSDDMKVEVSQGAEGLKVVVRGTNIDSRPFLKSISGPDAESGGKDIDLDLHTNVLSGQNSQLLTAVDLRFVRHGGQIRKVQLTGRVGRAPVSISSSQQGSVLTLTARSGDAGASLSFLDLYKRVSGGQLDTTIRILDNRIDGYATIHDFGLSDDPAMKRLTEESLSQRKSGDMRVDGANQNFTKLLVSFSKTGSRVEVKDGALFGPQLGATVQGSIDFARDRLALGGTFVPLYGVNNLFAQLPVVGTLLGGGAHEGLFGLNYKISGSVAAPNLTVDPLSALAPGFLRKIFGAISDAADQDGAPTPQRPGGVAGPDPAGR